MIELGISDLMLRALLADLDALDARLRDREAQSDPAVLAESARVVRAVVSALGTSQSKLAPMLGVAGEKTVRDWCSARMTPPRTALRAIRLLLERLVDPPPEELVLAQARFGRCGEALRPHLDELAARAAAAGWTDQEIVSGVRAWLAPRSEQKSRSGAGNASAPGRLDSTQWDP